jgi:hypothetical protein
MDKPNDRISARMREVFDAVPELERWPATLGALKPARTCKPRSRTSRWS